VKKSLLVCVVAVLACASVAGAATINLRVVTDKTNYMQGEPVYWSIYGWGNTSETRGIALLGVSLHDSEPENSLRPAIVNGPGAAKSLKDSLYNFFNYFVLSNGLASAGTPGTGILADIDIRQPDNTLVNIGNDGNSNNLFARGMRLTDSDNGNVTGMWIPTEVGTHNLTLEVTGANYWRLNPTVGHVNPIPFESSSLTGTSFTVQVIPEPATMCLTTGGLALLSLLRRRRMRRS